jgi:ubiquinone/menaquinone biosynthesis C-methylase UbiE
MHNLHCSADGTTRNAGRRDQAQVSPGGIRSNINPPGRNMYRNKLKSKTAAAIPFYLSETYWWAYIHPQAVNFFERQWIVNLILWGNFARLRDAALAELGDQVSGRTLQVACVYGDFSAHLAKRIAPGSSLDIIDVLPIQIANLRRKLPAQLPVSIYQRDSTALGFADGSYDQVIVFFLLHEQPEKARRETLREAIRVTRPGGKVVLVDYHGPHALHPLRYVFQPILRLLEPFAIDLWRSPLSTWLPETITPAQISKDTYFGGLYQKVVITV